VVTEQGVPFVYRRTGSGVVKQEVERGAMNDDEVIITRGLDEHDEVLLSPPPDKAKLPLIRLPGSKVVTGDSGTGGQKIPPGPATPATPAGSHPAPPRN
jgi:hypothetical protein